MRGKNSENGWAGFLPLIHARWMVPGLFCSPQKVIVVIYNILPRAMILRFKVRGKKNLAIVNTLGELKPIVCGDAATLEAEVGLVVSRKAKPTLAFEPNIFAPRCTRKGNTCLYPTEDMAINFHCCFINNNPTWKQHNVYSYNGILDSNQKHKLSLLGKIE